MNQPMRYFEWDYTNDSVVEYERSGECNECGQCCTRVIRFVIRNNTYPITGWNPHNGATAPLQSGRFAEVRVGDKRRFFNNAIITDEIVPCTMLTAEKRCAIHAGKHLLARAWPMTPDHVSAIPECSYSFREVGRWKISELEGAPV
jgi:Fe-S-cluster containining protein